MDVCSIGRPLRWIDKNCFVLQDIDPFGSAAKSWQFEQQKANLDGEYKHY